jgi:phospholipid-binding lipoprotein MlaA
MNGSRFAHPRSLAWALIIVLAVASGALADVYSSEDGTGIVHFSTVPTANSQLFMKQAPRPRAASESAANPAPAARPASLAEPRESDPFGASEIEEYDPWEPFNEWTFAFNYKLDRYVMKPAAKAWIWIVPEPARHALGNAFSNLDTPRRFANSLLQGKFGGAAREIARFLLNSTVGVGSLFDVAKACGIEKSDEDMGQTLAVYGAGPGPYLVLPFLPPLTVRDGIGYGIDSFASPWGYVFPFGARVGIRLASTVNERADNLQTFQDVEETTIDLYGAVRNGYLQRRRRAILE